GRTAVGGLGVAAVAFVLAFLTLTVLPLPVVPARATVALEIARPPMHVWDFVRRPEWSSLTNPGVEEAYHVPGTPDGVGNRQVLVGRPVGILRRRPRTELEVTADVPGVRTDVRLVRRPPLKGTWV